MKKIIIVFVVLAIFSLCSADPKGKTAKKAVVKLLEAFKNYVFKEVDAKVNIEDVTGLGSDPDLSEVISKAEVSIADFIELFKKYNFYTIDERKKKIHGIIEEYYDDLTPKFALKDIPGQKAGMIPEAFDKTNTN